MKQGEVCLRIQADYNINMPILVQATSVIATTPTSAATSTMGINPILAYSLEKILQTLTIIAWPLVIFLILIFFKEVFAYMFFSMSEFNFFGAKGKLKNVREMIREEANKLKRREDEQKRIESERKEHQKALSEIRDEKMTTQQKAQKAERLAEVLFKENEQLKEIITDQQTQIENLQQSHLNTTISKNPDLSINVADSISVAENVDVGATNPESASST